MQNTEFIKYPGIPYIEAAPPILKSSVYVFEKLDGGNCQVRKINGRIVPGSRSNFLQGAIVDRVDWFKDFVAWANKNTELYSLDENFVIFGEWLASSDIASAEGRVMYDGENTNSFYFLDVHDIGERRIIPYDEALEYLQIMGISLSELRILGRGKHSLRRLEELLIEDSDYRKGSKEGIVVKDYKRQRFAKILHPEYSEKLEGDRSLSEPEKYVTYNRWRKTKEALKEEGVKLTLDSIISRIKLDIQKGHKVSLNKREVYRRLKGLGIHNQ